MLREIKSCAFGHGWVEIFDNADAVVTACKNRPLNRAAGFSKDEQKKQDKSFTGVESWAEACEMLKTGYQPAVEKLKTGIKANLAGQGKRINFFNDIVGFAPIVSLALQGVPNSMQNSYMKPIKAKVLDVYYDMAVSWNVRKEDLQKAGEKLLGAIMELEMQGYKFNLYAIQTYADAKSFDMLCTKVKNSNTPLDLRKISFPLTHPGYFRAIGFDWYSRMPKAKYRHAYGDALSYDHNETELQKGFQEIFGKNVVVFAAANIIKEDSEYIKNTLTGGTNNVA